MRRFLNLMTLAVICFSLSTASNALAGHGGGHGHSGGQSESTSKHSNHSFTKHNNQQFKNKVVTGSKNGVGYIADPVPRHLNQRGPKVTKIMDPIRPKSGNANVGQVATVQTVQTNLIGLAPKPAVVPPVVRDHTVPQTTVTTTTPARTRYDSITSEGFGDSVGNAIVGLGDALGFDGSFGIGFTATYHHAQVEDHRTQPTSGHYGHSRNPVQPFTPNTQGPANQR